MKRHARSLVELIKQHFGVLKPIRGAEVGVWRGELSEALLTHLPKLTLFMVDPWENLIEGTPTMLKKMNEVIAAREEAEARTGRLRRVIYQMTSLEASKDLLKQNQSFHFVFVDAVHLYEYVRDDLTAWLPLVKEGGLICGHDYNGVGDRRCGWGVKRAVDDQFGSTKVNVLPGNVWWVQKVS